MTMDRRGFLELTGAAGASALGQAQLKEDARKFDAYGVLIGPEAARPPKDGEYFRKFDTYHFAYFATDGGAYTITHRDSGWRGAYAFEPGVTLVDEANDLPAPVNGVHELDGQTTYFFTDFVASPYSLDPNGSPLIGYHGATSGFIHTGGQTAITTSSGLFMRHLYVHAPFGQVFNIVADQTTEMLAESCAFSDAAGIGNIADLGTFDGLRVPTFKGCNFEDFDAGFDFDGDSEKILISGSPFRGVTAAGVTMCTLRDTSSCQIVDFTNNYVKDVQADTEVWRIEAGGEPSEVFQYRGNTHDMSFSRGNAITGPNAGPKLEPFWAKGSFPVRDSDIRGTLIGANLPATVTGSGSGMVQVNVPTNGLNTQRMAQNGNGVIEVTSSRGITADIEFSGTVLGASTEYRVGIGVNGSVIQESIINLEAANNSKPMPTIANYVLDLTQGDTVSIFLEHTGGTSDIDITSFNLDVAT